MKTFFTTAILLVALTNSIYGQKAVHSYIDKIKEADTAIAITIPGWMARMGVRMALDEEVKDSKGYADIVKGIKQIRFVVLDEGKMPTTEQMEKMAKDIKEKDGLEDYVKIKDDGAQVWVMIKEVEDIVKNLLVLTLEEEGLFIVSATLDIPLKSLEAADFEFNKARHNNN